MTDKMLKSGGHQSHGVADAVLPRGVLRLMPIAVLLMPLVMRQLFGLPWLMLQNFTDGVFYLGYASQFEELVAEIGLHYYTVRFPAIATDALFLWLTGSVWGFFVWRYLLGGCVALRCMRFSHHGDRWSVVFLRHFCGR